MVMATKTEVTVMTDEMVTWMAWLAVAALTQCESMKRCWLERVSTCVKAKEYETETHLCHPSHLPVLQNIQMDSVNINGDVEESNLYLQKSAKC